MPKMLIDLPVASHQKLKELARSDGRSLTNYLLRQMVLLSEGKLVYVPEGSEITITTSTLTPLASTPTPTPTLTNEEKEKKLLDRIKKLLGSDLYELWEHEITEGYIYIASNEDAYYPFAEPIPGKSYRAAYTLPEDKLALFLDDMKEYILYHTNKGTLKELDIK